MEIPFICPDKYEVPHVDLHIHTKYTDGLETIDNIFQEALNKNIETIAITDHVWRTSTYLNQYFNEIKNKRDDIQLNVLAGIEAKVVNIDGSIDATSEIIEESEIVLGSLHSIPTEEDYNFLDPTKVDEDVVINNLYEATLNLIKSKKVDVIAHPTFLLNKIYGNKDFYEWQIEEIASKAAKHNIAIEINMKYNDPSLTFLKICKDKGVSFSVGSDAHILKDVGNINYARLSEKIKSLESNK